MIVKPGNFLPGGCLLLASLLFFVSCGEDEKKDENTSATYTFSADIAPIISSTCSQAGGCHEATNTVGNEVYVDNKANLVARKSGIIDRLNGRNGAVMPEAGSGITLSSADKKKIEDYLNQSTHE